MSIEVLASNKDTPANRELVAWLHGNIARLVGAGRRFELRVVRSDEEKRALVARGIKRLPHAMIDGKACGSSTEIIAALNKRALEPEPEQSMRSFYENMLAGGEGDEGDDDDEDNDQDVKRARFAEDIAKQNELRTELTNKHKKPAARGKTAPAVAAAPAAGSAPPAPRKKSTAPSEDDRLILTMLGMNENFSER